MAAQDPPPHKLVPAPTQRPLVRLIVSLIELDFGLNEGP